MKALKSLVRLHRLRLDEKRKFLGELESRRADLLRRRDDLRDELRAEKAAALASLDAGSTFPAYLTAFEARRDRAASLLVEIGRRIVAARDGLAESFRDLKQHEMVLANRMERVRKEAARRERIELDDLGIDMHRRKAKENA